MVKIIYDARYLLLDERHDGVSRYTHGLAHALARRKDVDMTWLVYDERQLMRLPDGEYIIANDPKNVLKELMLPRLLNKQSADVVYSPFFMMGTLGHHYPLVLTIHDMIYFAHKTPPYQFSWWIRGAWWLFHLTYWPMRWILHQATAVATVSATAKHELEAAHATRRPITTVLNAVEQTTVPLTKTHHDKTHIVYMGAFMPYKNPECLIDMMPYLPDMTLDFMSKIIPERETELQTRANKLGVGKRVVFHGGVTDEVYYRALSGARCLISASKIEGFGLPIIEAQQQGVPVVCSDIPIFHEVGAHSVLYFDPNSPIAAAAQVKKLADPAMSRDYITRGIENARRFTWDDAADTAVEICQTIVNKLP